MGPSSVSNRRSVNPVDNFFSDVPILTISILGKNHSLMTSEMSRMSRMHAESFNTRMVEIGTIVCRIKERLRSQKQLVA